MPISGAEIGWRAPVIYHPPIVHETIELFYEDRQAFSKECIGYYNDGVSLNEIARIVGRSKCLVRRVLHTHGCWTGKMVREGTYTAWRRSGRPNRTRAQAFFGYTYYLGKLVEQPREQQILTLIKRLASERKSATMIANHLNARGMKPRKAKTWHRNSIIKILERLTT